MIVAKWIAVARFTYNVVIHKLYILFYGLWVVGGIPFVQLLTHDCSKFGCDEMHGYAMHLYSTDNSVVDDAERTRRKREFDSAFDHHQKANGHHFQHWMARDDRGELIVDESRARDMPEVFVREMVCDWMAANAVYRSFGPRDTRGRVNHQWLEQHLGSMTLTLTSRQRVALVLAQVGELSPTLQNALRL
jgi:hypothetical protein